MKECARCLGMSTKTIEVKNIVVGDLPFDQTRGDFYVCISVATNPDMVTALQEDKMPKLVHFPEILQLKLRDSPLEPRVVITVKELNICGSEELCDLTINAATMLDFARDDEPLKRFQMRVMNSSIERETPPWIAMEFSMPTESRNLGELTNIWNMLKVRIWKTPENDIERQHAAQTQLAEYNRTSHLGKHASTMTSDGTILGTRKNEDDTIRDFKFKYNLLDDSGNPIEEPDENDIVHIRRRRICFQRAFHFCNCFVFLAIIGYAGFRFYVWSCYRQFVWLTSAQMLNQTSPAAPISTAHLRDLAKKCNDIVRGTGTPPGTPCRPSYLQTLNTCETLPDSQRPEAFVGIAYDVFGLDDFQGLQCFHGICKFRDQLTTFDWYTVWIALFLILLTRCCKCYGDIWIQNYKKKCQKENALRLQEFRASVMRTRGGTLGSPAIAAAQAQGGYTYGGAGLGGYGGGGFGSAAGYGSGAPGSPGGRRTHVG